MNNYRFENVEIVPHPTARSQARAIRSIPAGSTVISEPAFAFALLDVEKGRRCDACFRRDYEGRWLKKCTGCASYYYCDADCQKMHWNLEHKRICKVYNRMITLVGSRQLARHERMDVLLLSHFLARINPFAAAGIDASSEVGPLSVFLSLLPGPGTPSDILDMLPKPLNPQQKLTKDIYSRFQNNNFTVHSHMTIIGHGVFPLASRLFNHSCVPNAVPRYVFAPANSVVMEVVALRDVDLGEEVCVPYLDPALTQSRRQAFQFTYGFTCGCTSCTILRGLGQASEPPHSCEERTAINSALRTYVGLGNVLGAELPMPSLADVPTALRCVLHETYMEQLSEQFSKTAHEGEYGTAVESGLTLLALYLLLYPRNYPQVGLHLLELAKTRWNALISSSQASTDVTEAEAQVRITLNHARTILTIYGREGDEYGPVDEIQKLEEMLAESDQ
ncbi:N-lysine methyltransferase SMYD2-B [Leucoagaricus sp. SymC.cos]|nr:N-lysine methyltransferase SMYD2-B [Leucoagaricus sp. SymC.cos]